MEQETNPKLTMFMKFSCQFVMLCFCINHAKKKKFHLISQAYSIE